MKFEISKIKLVKNSYGQNDLVISQVKVMDNDGSYIKFAKLNNSLLNALKDKGTISIKK